jgi:hypothetical protein
MTMTTGISAVDRLLRLPGDLAAALAVVPAIADHTASLYEMTRTLKRISEDTDALPPLRADMGRVAEATDVLSDVDAKLKTISEAMPVLVEVQRHLDQLPETMAGLDAGIDRLRLLIERMLPSMEALGGNVETLREELGPVSRLASRVPGQRNH